MVIFRPKKPVMDGPGSTHAETRIESQRHPGVLRFWKWECVLLVLSIALLSAIIAVLITYNGRPLPQWPHEITINTLLALMSTTLRACIVGVLAPIIGQAKWLWFYSERRPLHDLQVFDQASRGFIGSFRIMKFLRTGLLRAPVPFLAAMTMILSVAVGPFTQQAVKTATCSDISPAADAFLPVAYNLPGPDNRIRRFAGHWEPGNGFKAAAVNGLANPSGKDTQIEVTCPTGNCTFTQINNIPFSTLAMCTKCIDMTSHIQIKRSETGDLNCTIGDVFALPSGSGNSYKLNIGVIDLSNFTSSFPKDFVDVSLDGISNVTAIGAGVDTATPGNNACVATTCSLYICKQDIQARVENGVLKETVVSTTPARLVGTETDHFQATQHEFRVVPKNPCIINETVYAASNFSLVPNTTTRMFMDLLVDGRVTSVPSDCYYSIEPVYAYSMSEWFRESLLNGFCSMMTTVPDDFNCDVKFWLKAFWDWKNMTSAYQEQAFINFARSVTNFLRADGYGPLNDTNAFVGYPVAGLTSGHVHGQAQRLTVCVELHWPWLLYTSVLCLVTVVLFFASLISGYTHRDVAVWKSSLLPFLLLDFRTAQALHPSGLETQPHSLDQLKKKSVSTNAKYSYVHRDSIELDMAERPAVSPLSLHPSTTAVSEMTQSQDRVEAVPMNLQSMTRFARKPVPRGHSTTDSP